MAVFPPRLARRGASRGALLLAAALFCAVGAARADSIIIGSDDNRQFFPFGGLTPIVVPEIIDGNITTLRYQQRYDRDNFASLGPIAISAVTFFESLPGDQIGGGGVLCDSGQGLSCGFTIRLGTFDGPLDPNPVNNVLIGPVVFASGVQFTSSSGGVGGGTLAFGGLFNYSAARDLVVDVQITGFGMDPAEITGTLNDLFYQLTDDLLTGGDPVTEYATNFDGSGGVGLRTQFDYVEIVPEPGTAPLLALGLLGLGVRGRGNRR